MFELSDEDDNFWDDVPLGDITNTKPAESVMKDVQNTTRIPSEIGRNPAKRYCTGESVSTRETVSKPHLSATVEVVPVGERGPPSTTMMTGSVTERSTPLATNFQMDLVQDNQTPGNRAAVRERIVTPVGSSAKATPGSTPRRPKRKFPGPAGLLPKLQPGQSMDSASLPGVTGADPEKSNKEDPVILSSQSSDDVFLDSPWQTLLQDLEDDNTQLLRKFSIATIPLKAGKKQLWKGKVAMVFAVIENLDTHGSDASVTLRDKSGRIQGTVHRDLLKDYEAELQPGTVIVLRQVSVISLTNKNHYLNITPSNIVVMYQNKNSQMQKIKFHGSQDSLRSILVSLERKSCQDSVERTSTHGTPSSLNSSRLASGNSSCSTPILFNAMLNQSGQGFSDAKFTPRTPGVRDVSFTPRAPGVRDVRFTPSNVRTPSVSVRQNGSRPLTPQTITRGSNPQTPRTELGATSQMKLGNTPVPNINRVGPNYTTGHRNTAATNTPVSNYSGIQSNSNIRQQITPVPNICSVGINPISGQRTTSFSNRSMSASCLNVNKGSVQSSKGSSALMSIRNNSTNRMQDLRNSSVSSHLDQSKVANDHVSSHSNVVKLNVVNHDSDRKVSPESNSNKRKWSFRSPTSSSSVCAPQMNNNSSSTSNTGNSNENSLHNNLHQSKVKDIVSETVKRPLNSSLNNRQNMANSSRTVGPSNTERTLHNKMLEDYNNNQSRAGVNVNDKSGNKTIVPCSNSGVSNLTNQISSPAVSSKSKWSFKSRSVTSPTVPEKSSPPLIGQNVSPDTAGTNQKTEDLWQDDLSDDLLSQLSDEMM